MKKLALLLIVVVASCGPSKEKLEEERNAEIRRNIRFKDSLICATFRLADTVRYK